MTITQNPLDLQNFKLAVDNSTDHITFSDSNGVVTYANKAVERLTGFTQNEIIGHKAGARELWGGLMPKEYYANLWDRIKNQKKPFHGEFKNKRKDGSIFYTSASIFPVLDQQGNVTFFVEVHRDITHSVSMERAKSDLLSFTGHKLQTPLTISKWNLELLQQNQELTPEQQQNISTAILANKKMIQLVDELLFMMRVELGKFKVFPETLDPTTVMKQTIHDMLPVIRAKHLEVHESYGPIAPLPLDKKILVMIYNTILSNAIYYTPDHGRIEVSITTDQKNGELVTSVADAGFGITAEDRDKVFTKHFRSKNALLTDPQGSGVGLFNTQRFVVASGGRIWFQTPSPIGTPQNPGAIFYVAFPLSGMYQHNAHESYEGV